MAEGEQKHLTAAGEGVESYNCAVALLHSKIFFWFNALVFLVIIWMLVWILMAPHHYTHHYLFILLEMFVTIVTALVLAIEIYYQGYREFFCRPVHPQASAWSKCKTISVALLNWSQVLLLVASAVFVSFYFTGESVAEVVESEIVLGIFVTRYLLYIVVLLVIQSRTYDKQKYQFRKETFSGGHDEWDVQFPDSDEDDADFLRSDSLHAHLTRPKARQLHATRGINGEA